MNSYQKLKAENTLLKQQLITVCNETDFLEAAAIKLEWQLVYQTANICSITPAKTVGNGIFDKLKTDEQSYFERVWK